VRFESKNIFFCFEKCSTLHNLALWLLIQKSPEARKNHFFFFLFGLPPTWATVDGHLTIGHELRKGDLLYHAYVMQYFIGPKLHFAIRCYCLVWVCWNDLLRPLPEKSFSVAFNIEIIISIFCSNSFLRKRKLVNIGLT
jgi:hypothetical protein